MKKYRINPTDIQVQINTGINIVRKISVQLITHSDQDQASRGSTDQTFSNQHRSDYNLYLSHIDSGMFYDNFDGYNLNLSTASCNLLIGHLAEARLLWYGNKSFPRKIF